MCQHMGNIWGGWHRNPLHAGPIYMVSPLPSAVMGPRDSGKEWAVSLEGKESWTLPEEPSHAEGPPHAEEPPDCCHLT